MDQVSVMVVEDEPIEALGIRTQLQSMGYTVPAVVSYGEDAVHQAADLRPDLVLMDVRLKGKMDGIEAAHRIQSESDIPVVYVTAYADPDALRRAESAAFGYVLKPYSKQELQGIIEMALTKHRMDQAARTYTARLEQSNAGLALVRRLIEAVAEGQDSCSLLRNACRDMASLFDAPYAVAVHLEQDGQTAQLTGAFLLDEQWQSLEATVEVDGTPLLHDVLARREPWVLDDITQAPRLSWLSRRLPRDETFSLLVLPLVIRGEVAGGFALAVTRERGFTEEDVALGRVVAGHIAAALARATGAGEQGQPGTGHDSVQQEVAESLAQQERHYQSIKMEAMAQLARGIAHEFNNLLTAVNGNASLLAEGMVDDREEVMEVGQAILGAGQQAAELTRRLLTFTRKQVHEPRVVNLNDILFDMSGELDHIAGDHISCQTHLDPDLWPAYVDPVQMEQVITHLAMNARDAMPRGGQLTVRTANTTLSEACTAYGLGAGPGDYVVLSISDTGIGMSQEVQAHLFEPFFTTKDVGQGTGLGLATVHGIVKQCSGTVEVQSKEGGGTLFRVYLPRARERNATRELPELHAAGQRAQETILLVEDDESICELTRRVLARCGYRLLVAHDGLEAERVAAQHQGPIDLLLTDLAMPRMDGKTLARRLSETRPGLKIMLMSGYAETAPSARGAQVEGMAFIQKPFRPQDLVQKVRALLEP